MISRGKWVKLGLILSILFCHFLLQMGMGVLTAARWQGFLFNRLPTLVMMALQVSLLWGWDEQSIPEIVRSLPRRVLHLV